MEDNPDWWKALPCHLNPDWNLLQQSNLDIRKLKHQVEDDLRLDLQFMRVENLLYQAFLEMPPKLFLRFELPSPQRALKFLQEAEDFIEITMKNDVDAQNGYGIVINALRMWIYDNRGSIDNRNKTENILRRLQSSQNDDSRAFINATRALALSRLGLEWCEEAMGLFEMALKQCHDRPNIYWMFVRAIMQGRLARSDKSTMYGSLTLDENVTKAFEREREMLEEIREKEPTFAWPIAYLGQCLYHLGRKEEALRCLQQAMSRDKRNTDIALISARVYKLNEKSLQPEEIFKRLPDKLFSESEELLNKLPEESKTPEVFLQLGLIYKWRAKELSFCPAVKLNCNKKKEHMRLVKKAIEYVEKALEKDPCHNAAAIKMAELLVLTGENGKAKDAYFDLIHREGTLPLNQFHVLKSANSKHIRKVFDKTEVLHNIFGMLDLCIKNFTKFDKNGVGTFVNTVKNDAEAFLEELESMGKDENSEPNTLAKNFFAQVLRRLGKYEDGKQVILSLIEQPQNNMAELRWSLAKCYCGLGELDKAEGEAKTLTELPPKRKFQADEIYADVYLARAKENQICKNKEHYKLVIDNLRRAINKGSIEACHLFLKNVESPKERLCSLEGAVVQTIAEIEACLERTNNFHHNFDEYSDDPIDSIRIDITSILDHPRLADESLPKIHQIRYQTLSRIRTGLRDFEGCYLQLRGSGSSWNTVCQEAATKVLSDARELLDHVIYDYQKQFRKTPGKPKNNIFPVHMDWNKAEVNQELTKTKFEGYVKSKFPGHLMSPEMITFFIELQPMYSKDNLWLAALGQFTGNKKHTGIDDDDDNDNDSEMYYIILDYAENIACKKVVLVRKTCYEVERIAEKILSYLQSQTPCSG